MKPSKQEVAELVRKTGESPHKCYYWLLAELNKDQTQDNLFDVKTDTSTKDEKGNYRPTQRRKDK